MLFILLHARASEVQLAEAVQREAMALTTQLCENLCSLCRVGRCAVAGEEEGCVIELARGIALGCGRLEQRRDSRRNLVVGVKGLVQPLCKGCDLLRGQFLQDIRLGKRGWGEERSLDRPHCACVCDADACEGALDGRWCW